MKINYSVKLVSPANTATLGNIDKITDIGVKLNSNGEPIFYGKQIKGILKNTMISFINALNLNKKDEFINRFFGEEGEDLIEKTFNKIRFSNLTLAEKSNDIIKNRYGIRVDRKLKTAVPNSLFNYEYIKAGTIFNGSIEVNDNIDKNELRFILACLFHLDYIGGLKSRGLGKVEVLTEGRTIAELDKIISNLKGKLKNKKLDLSIADNELEKYSYTLKLTEPIILKKRSLGNYFYCKDIIQGSTLRGALIRYFLKRGINLETLLKLEVSDALTGKVPLASEFQTKYEIEKDKGKVSKDKVIYMEREFKNIKLERKSLSILKVTGNEFSIGMDIKTRSAKENLLFNHEFIEYYNELKGDILAPKGLLKNKDYTIYLGRLKSKGFGKATISFAPYTEQEKLKLEERIERLNSQIKLEDKNIITFDLNSDLILPFNEIYNIAEQFKMLLPFETEMKFDSKRSFINTDILHGYNIINNSRKVDELIICRGSVITYEIPQYKNYLAELKSIEDKGLGLRKYEGFGKVKICSERGDECGTIKGI